MVVFFVSETFIRINVEEIEDKLAEESVSQVLGVLDEKINRIDTFTTDYAGWDDTYYFIQNLNEDYVESNLLTETLVTTRIGFMLYVNKDGQIVEEKTVDLGLGIGVFTPESLIAEIEKGGDILNHKNTNDVRRGVLALSDGTRVIVASRPILTSTKEGPIMGTLIFGEFLDDFTLKDIENKTKRKIVVHNTDSTDAHVQQVIGKLSGDIATVVETPDNNTLIGYALIKDVYDNPTMLLQVELPRDYYTQSRKQSMAFVISIIAIGLLSYLAGIVYFERLVLLPLRTITRDLARIRTKKDTSLRVELTGSNEIRTLASHINDMIEALSEYEAKLVNINEALKKENKDIESIVKQRTVDLKEERARLLSTFNYIPNGLCITNTRLEIALTNPGMYKALGIEDTEHGLTFDRLQSIFKDSLNIKELCDDCLEYGKPISQEIRYQNNVLNLYIAAIKSLDKTEKFGLIILLTDMTQIRLHERSQDELINILSHELRTPLSVIKGYVSMLQKASIVDESIKKELSGIDVANQHLIELVNNVLTLYKLEQNKLIFDESEITIAKLLNEVVVNLEPEHKYKDLKINQTIQDENIKVLADNEKLKLVASNIILNAIKYTEHGTIDIFSEVEGNKLKIKIKDTGIGVAKKNQSMLFKKFQRAGDTIHGKENLSEKGMGLYISKLLMEKMGGDLYLEFSDLGAGSIFVFTVRLVIE